MNIKEKMDANIKLTNEEQYFYFVKTWKKDEGIDGNSLTHFVKHGKNPAEYKEK